MDQRLYILRRFVFMVITFFLLMTLVFFMFRFIPGDPLIVYLDTEMDLEAQKRIMAKFGLDRPLHEQYFLFVRNTITGDLGTSFHYSKPVIELIGERLWNTIVLMGTGILLSYIIGVVLGALAAWKRGSPFEKISIVVVLALRSAPIFWLGIILMMIFSMRLNLLPLGGIRQMGINLSSQFQKFFSLDFLHHLILPAITLAIYYMGSPFLIMRSAMLEVMNEEFIEMVKAKGLKSRQVIFRHAMRNSTLPVITLFTVLVSFIMGGQVMLETIFRWPGIGMEMVQAISRKDYPMAQALFMMMGVIILIMNFIVDFLYGYLDPRVRVE
jgi:peptide/nickel transport system permease protein